MANPTEKELLRKALSYLLLISNMRDQAGFHVAADSKIFVQEVLRPLEKARDEYKSAPAKKALALIASQRTPSHIAFHQWLDSSEFKADVLTVLWKASGTTLDEKRLITEAAQELRALISNETNPTDQWKTAKKTLIAAAGLAAGVGIITGLAILFRKKEPENKKKAGE